MGIVRRALLPPAVTALMLAFSPLTYANSYGIFDARGLGMGGVGMSTGNLRTGHLYNPAVLAFHHGDEDRLNHGQHTLTVVLGPLAGSAESAVDAARDDLESRLDDAVSSFNTAPDLQSARRTADAAADLQRLLEDVEGEDLAGEAYAGYTVTEPSDRSGGAFFMGVRTLGGGKAAIAAEDLALLDDYVTTLSSADPSTLNPDYLNDDGTLVNPLDTLSSSARTRAIILAEVGVSLAHQLRFLDQPVAVGISPKVVRARAYDDQWTAFEGEFSSTGYVDDSTFVNFDVGVSWEIDQRYRLAIAGKDVINKSFSTDDGLEVELSGRYRAGISYFSRDYVIAIEADLLGIPSLTPDLKRQDVSIGAEYEFGTFLDIRAGYRIDARNNFGDLMTAGVGLEFGLVTVEFAVAAGSEDRSAALQLGILH